MSKTQIIENGSIGDQKRVIVHYRKSMAHGLIARGLLIVGGVILAIAAVAMMLTVIGIIPGIGAFIFGIAMIALAVWPEAKVPCPYCDYADTRVSVGSLNMTCRKCKGQTILDWAKPQK